MIRPIGIWTRGSQDRMGYGGLLWRFLFVGGGEGKLVGIGGQSLKHSKITKYNNAYLCTY